MLNGFVDKVLVAIVGVEYMSKIVAISNSK
jgi:hypothetical protein